MAIFMPAACNPWAMDHAMERLLATPKTTAVRPCKSEDMGGSLEWDRITVRGENSEVRMQAEYKRGCASALCRPVSSREPGRLPNRVRVKSRGRVARVHTKPLTRNCPLLRGGAFGARIRLLRN